MNAAETVTRRRAALERLAETGALPRADLAADEAFRTGRERRRNRVLAVLVWFVTAYPLSAGPAVYAAGRGWVPPTPVVYFYTPLIGLGTAVRPAGEALEAYTRLFEDAARRHSGR